MNNRDHKLTLTALTAFATVLLTITGCGAKHQNGEAVATVTVESVLQPGPHGGKLIPIGDRQYFLEFVFAPPATCVQTNHAGKLIVVPEQRGSRLNCYLLDATAKVPAKYPIGLKVLTKNLMGDQDLPFMPSTDRNDLAVGRFGLMYTAQAKWIDEQETIEGVVKQIQIDNRIFTDVPIKVARGDMRLFGNL